MRRPDHNSDHLWGAAMIHQDRTDRAVELAKQENLYARLGVSSNAGTEEITHAYRQLARSLHPDRKLSGQCDTQEAFARINDAHEILKDLARRSEYDREQARSSHSHESWAGGAQVDSKHRERYRSSQADLDQEIRDLHLPALKLLSIEASTEGILRWLSNPPESPTSPGKFDLVIKAAVGLKLIDSIDAREAPHIMHNLRKALTMVGGTKGSEARELEDTLKKTGFWDDHFFETGEITAARALNAQHILAHLIRDHCKHSQSLSVGILAGRFSALKEDLVTSGWITHEGVSDSPIVKDALRSVSQGFARRIEQERYAFSLALLTDDVHGFLKRNALTLPDDCKASLTNTYVTWITEHLGQLRGGEWVREAAVKKFMKLIQATDSMGLCVGEDLRYHPLFSSRPRARA
jgi:DnaJ-domain-containing protein 1